VGEIKALAGLMEFMLKAHGETEDKLFIGRSSIVSKKSASARASTRTRRD